MGANLIEKLRQVEDFRTFASFNMRSISSVVTIPFDATL